MTRITSDPFSEARSEAIGRSELSMWLRNPMRIGAEARGGARLVLEKLQYLSWHLKCGCQKSAAQLTRGNLDWPANVWGHWRRRKFSHHRDTRLHMSSKLAPYFTRSRCFAHEETECTRQSPLLQKQNAHRVPEPCRYPGAPGNSPAKVLPLCPCASGCSRLSRL
jgi:hypothetical protein